jgi:hypothetical protein
VQWYCLRDRCRDIGLQAVLVAAFHDLASSAPKKANPPNGRIVAAVFETNPPPGPADDAVGMHFLSDALADRVKDLLPAGGGRKPGWKTSDRMHLWRALAGHHGRPPADVNRVSGEVVCNGCHNAARKFLDVMRMVFQPSAWKRPATDREVMRLTWRLAGLTTLSDCVGSRQAWFPCAQAVAVADPAACFWGHALPRAAAALAAAGLVASAPLQGAARSVPRHFAAHTHPAVGGGSGATEWARAGCH